MNDNNQNSCKQQQKMLKISFKVQVIALKNIERARKALKPPIIAKMALSLFYKIQDKMLFVQKF